MSAHCWRNLITVSIAFPFDDFYDDYVVMCTRVLIDYYGNDWIFNFCLSEFMPTFRDFTRLRDKRIESCIEKNDVILFADSF